MENTLSLTAILILSYFCGSIPTAVVVSKRFFGFDIREKGSKSSGSTNAFRLLGWKWGVFVQLFDILKAVFPILIIVPWLGQEIQIPGTNFAEKIIILKLVAGLFAVFGHIWSVFVGFKGGKGVNTTVGLLVALAPLDFGIGMIVFFLAVFSTGYISLGSMTGAVTVATSMFVRYNFFAADIPGYNILIYFFYAVAVLLIFTHKTNIGRLIKGEENRFEKLHLIKFGSKKAQNKEN